MNNKIELNNEEKLKLDELTSVYSLLEKSYEGRTFIPIVFLYYLNEIKKDIKLVDFIYEDKRVDYESDDEGRFYEVDFNFVAFLDPLKNLLSLSLKNTSNKKDISYMIDLNEYGEQVLAFAQELDYTKDEKALDRQAHKKNIFKLIDQNSFSNSDKLKKAIELIEAILVKGTIEESLIKVDSKQNNKIKI